MFKQQAGVDIQHIPYKGTNDLIADLLTGRVPIAQPPGSETRALPTRASSGPSTRIDARIFRTRS